MNAKIKYSFTNQPHINTMNTTEDEVISTEQDARNQSETCQFCDSDDMFVGGLCYICAKGHYE